jgi:integrase
MSEEQKHRGVYEWPPGSKVWWIQYFENGRRHREKVGRRSWAISRYQARKTEIREGRFISPSAKTTIGALWEIIKADYAANSQNLEPIETAWKRLKDDFEGMRADSLTTDHVLRYVRARTAEDYSNASINRDIACLRRMYNLAARSTPPKVSRLPVFPSRLRESPPRSGFLTDPQFRKLSDLPLEPWLRAFLAIAYKFGMRKEEILSLRVAQVDFPAGIIRLHPGTTKNDEGRIAPITAELRPLLAACSKGKEPADFLLTRSDGRRVKDFRGLWDILLRESGLPSSVIIHDFRRSAIRNMLRRGIPERIAMAISGHKTRSVFDRYNIVAEQDILEAGRKLEGSMRTSGATRTATRGKQRKAGTSVKRRPINKL